MVAPTLAMIVCASSMQPAPRRPTGGAAPDAFTVEVWTTCPRSAAPAPFALRQGRRRSCRRPRRPPAAATCGMTSRGSTLDSGPTGAAGTGGVSPPATSVDAGVEQWRWRTSFSSRWARGSSPSTHDGLVSLYNRAAQDILGVSADRRARSATAPASPTATSPCATIAGALSAGLAGGRSRARVQLEVDTAGGRECSATASTCSAIQRSSPWSSPISPRRSTASAARTPSVRSPTPAGWPAPWPTSSSRRWRPSVSTSTFCAGRCRPKDRPSATSTSSPPSSPIASRGCRRSCTPWPAPRPSAAGCG